MAEQPQAIPVEIYGRVYYLRSGPDERYARRLAQSVDTVMRAIAEKTRTVDSLQLAVLAALHFADDYQQLKEQFEKLNGMVSEKSVQFREELERAVQKGTDTPDPGSRPAEIEI